MTELQPAVAPGSDRAPLTIDAAAAESAGTTVTVGVFDRLTGRTLLYAPTARVDTASIVKLQVLEQLMVEARESGRLVTDEEWAHAEPMIAWSSDSDASELWVGLGSEVGTQAFAARLGLTDTAMGLDGWWGWTRTSALDQLRVVAAVTEPGGLLAPAEQERAVRMLAGIQADQRWGTPRDPGAQAWMKVGWMPQGRDYQPGWRVTSIGHVTGPGRDYLSAILTAADPDEQTGIDLCEEIGQQIYDQMPPP